MNEHNLLAQHAREKSRRGSNDERMASRAFVARIIHSPVPVSIHNIILIAPRWYIRLRLEISIALCLLLPSQVLSMSSLLFSFLPRSSSSKFLVDSLSSFFLYPVSTLNAVRVMLSRSFLITCPSQQQATSIFFVLLPW